MKKEITIASLVIILMLTVAIAAAPDVPQRRVKKRHNYLQLRPTACATSTGFTFVSYRPSQDDVYYSTTLDCGNSGNIGCMFRLVTSLSKEEPDGTWQNINTSCAEVDPPCNWSGPWAVSYGDVSGWGIGHYKATFQIFNARNAGPCSKPIAGVPAITTYQTTFVIN